MLPPTLLLPTPLQQTNKQTNTLWGLPTEPRTNLVEHILKIQLQIAEQTRRQGKAGQGMGQAGLQVSAENTAAQMLQRSGLPYQGKEGRVELAVLLGIEQEAQQDSLCQVAPNPPTGGGWWLVGVFRSLLGVGSVFWVFAL